MRVIFQAENNICEDLEGKSVWNLQENSMNFNLVEMESLIWSDIVVEVS